MKPYAAVNIPEDIKPPSSSNLFIKSLVTPLFWASNYEIAALEIARPFSQVGLDLFGSTADPEQRRGVITLEIYLFSWMDRQTKTRLENKIAASC